ncbi:hypothetical protein [Natrinema versiforme]|uniref:DUF8173 domain-containing protein n=1 Tax=Natrinema versiforme JCM 10478 TaxID=1227496 RepID=L9Y3B9_9EURY|nr:hypothetical protein [Natrinema versiforme]ELY68186.1 hypothetical protein C489_07920 [Natrinema versiforme JCM 10478]
MSLRAPRLRSAALTALLFLAAGPAPAIAQRAPDGVRTGAETAARYPWYIDAIVPAAVTLVIGGLLIVVSPAGTRRRTDRALESPGVAFVYGLVSLIGVIGASVLLSITVIGLVLAIPLLLGYVIVLIVAGELGYLAVGRLAADAWPAALAVAVVVAALVGLVPILGSLVGFVIGMIGMGTVVIELVD